MSEPKSYIMDWGSQEEIPYKPVEHSAYDRWVKYADLPDERANLRQRVEDIAWNDIFGDIIEQKVDVKYRDSTTHESLQERGLLTIEEYNNFLDVCVRKHGVIMKVDGYNNQEFMHIPVWMFVDYLYEKGVRA